MQGMNEYNWSRVSSEVVKTVEREENLWRVAKECIRVIEDAGGLGDNAIEVVARRMLKMIRKTKSSQK